MDEQYMRRALKLAKKGEGFTNPNPLVGAVIVKNGEIVGEGFHALYGEHHAEINALFNAGEQAKDATMYVTLEPCSHHGKTPPCTKAIIKSGIKRVVIASNDPNPLVSGRGVKELQDAGIEVESGLLEEENKRLNEIFFHYIVKGRPFVILKTAMSADGKTATKTGDAKWITNEKSRRFVHELRHRVQAIMVGVKTVIADNPLLTARLPNKKVRHPIRIVLDTCAETPLESNVLKNTESTRTIVAVTKGANEENIEALKRKGAEVWVMPTKDGHVDLQALVKALGEESIDSVLLEGGSFVNDSAFKAGIIQRFHLFIAPKIIGGDAAFTPVGGIGVNTVAEGAKLKRTNMETFDEDVLITYDVESGAI